VEFKNGCAQIICEAASRGYKLCVFQGSAANAPPSSREIPLSQPVTKTPGADGDLPRVGGRVRHFRLAKRMRLKDLAVASACSESLLSRVENNLTNPSLATLHRVASALGVSTVALFEDTIPSPLVIYTPEERLTIGRGVPGEKAEVLVPYAENRRLEGMITILLPGSDYNGPFQHEGEEVGYVLEGAMELTVGETVSILRPGDSFFFRSDLVHRYRNAGTIVCRVVWVNTPPTF
jgi:transcriptional regulator with XRE-family HTH domain